MRAGIELTGRFPACAIGPAPSWMRWHDITLWLHLRVERAGVALGRADRRNAFAVGDWYIAGQQEFGRAVVRQIITAPTWKGGCFDTVKAYAVIARAFPHEFRYLPVSRGTIKPSPQWSGRGAGVAQSSRCGKLEFE